MQIGANVSDRTYAPCKSRTSTNYFGRYMERDLEFIKERMQEILEKVKKGETEPSIWTGAQSFTEKEWDRMLERFDAAEDELKKLMREEHAKRLKENVNKTEILNSINSEEESMLVAETTTCSYPASEPQKEDIRYITWYTEEGIFCRKAGQSKEYEWTLSFKDSGQYNEVLAFLSQFSKDDNLRFAAHENFWEDFLDHRIDLQGFMEFYKSTEGGVPNYTVTDGDSMYVDREKIKYAQYMNSFNAQMMTQREFFEQQREIMQANQRLKRRL